MYYYVLAAAWFVYMFVRWSTGSGLDVALKMFLFGMSIWSAILILKEAGFVIKMGVV
jgi:hypothetical protein